MNIVKKSAMQGNKQKKLKKVEIFLTATGRARRPAGEIQGFGERIKP